MGEEAEGKEPEEAQQEESPAEEPLDGFASMIVFCSGETVWLRLRNLN